MMEILAMALLVVGCFGMGWFLGVTRKTESNGKAFLEGRREGYQAGAQAAYRFMERAPGKVPWDGVCVLEEDKNLCVADSTPEPRDQCVAKEPIKVRPQAAKPRDIHRE